jgi:CheY-like chemotaxis protein
VARILVVDDDPDIRALLETALQIAGHETMLAVDGNDALARQTMTPADLAIVDIFMPEKEGLETIMELRQRFPSLPILAMSGGGRTRNQDFLAQALLLGATRAIAKPFDYHNILELVSDMTARRESR